MASAPVLATERLTRRFLAGADVLANRVYGWRYNPLYQSGTLVVASYLVLLVTGLWLLLFYRVGTPWESVARLTENLWIGNWVRGLHRYASDLAIVATLIHAVRMFAQARSWGARTLAWISGAVLLLLIFVCGWTGYVMVWDTFGQALAREGARFLDALPILSEPTSRVFTGETPVPAVFFFVNLFLHIGLPLLMGVVFWLHVTRLPRTQLLPPRPVLWGATGAMALVAMAWPLEMAPRADPLVLPAEVPIDLFYAFWLPFTGALSGGTALLLATATGLALVVVPFVTSRRGADAPPSSTVDEDVCTGCTQCAVDCPYGAITMRERANGHGPLLAAVDPALCVSCGICAGSCAPMGVGPAGRTGRDQLARVRAFLASPSRRPGEIVVVSCEQGAGVTPADLDEFGAVAYPIGCAGNLHTSVLELLLRAGCGGLLVLVCPPRDCSSREGPRWLTERVYHEREAELQARVERTRIRIAYAAAGERQVARQILAEFAAGIATLSRPGSDAALGLEGENSCEPATFVRRRRT